MNICEDNYKINELSRYNNEVFLIEKSSLSDRKHGRDIMFHMLQNNLDRIKQDCEWVVNGSYGCGAMFSFKRLTKRMNRRACLFIMVAQLEYRTSNKLARDLWNSLDKELQDKINIILDEVISEHDLEASNL